MLKLTKKLIHFSEDNIKLFLFKKDKNNLKKLVFTSDYAERADYTRKIIRLINVFNIRNDHYCYDIVSKSIGSIDSDAIRFGLFVEFYNIFKNNDLKRKYIIGVNDQYVRKILKEIDRFNIDVKLNIVSYISYTYVSDMYDDLLVNVLDDIGKFLIVKIKDDEFMIKYAYTVYELSVKNDDYEKYLINLTDMIIQYEDISYPLLYSIVKIYKKIEIKNEQLFESYKKLVNYIYNTFTENKYINSNKPIFEIFYFKTIFILYSDIGKSRLTISNSKTLFKLTLSIINNTQEPRKKIYYLFLLSEMLKDILRITDEIQDYKSCILTNKQTIEAYLKTLDYSQIKSLRVRNQYQKCLELVNIYYF